MLPHMGWMGYSHWLASEHFDQAFESTRMAETTHLRVVQPGDTTGEAVGAMKQGPVIVLGEWRKLGVRWR